MLSSYFGYGGTGVVNLTDSGIITVYSGNGTIYLGVSSGSSGTLNLGTGGAAGTLNAASIYGGSGTAVVNFNHTGSLNFTPTLDGSLTVNHIGPGTTTLTAANTYTGTTSVLGGTLELGFDHVPVNILSNASALTLGGGTLRLIGDGGWQTLNGLTTTADTASRIVLGPSLSLDLGDLTSIGSHSALNFDVSAGGGNGDIIGSSIININEHTYGMLISPSFTVTDATGFGLATVNANGMIFRLTTSDLLPASGADSGTDYRIDNNNGGSTTAGSAALVVSTSEAARSITVDTTAASGILTLAPGAVLITDVWNFGGTGGHTYAIAADTGASGLGAATAGGMLQINNYNSSTVSINVPILDHGGSGLRVGGTGTTLLNGSASYTGETVISNGTVFINGDFSAATGDVTVQNTATLSGDGTLGGALHVQSGGILKPGNFVGLGALSGTTATFDSGSIFSIQGSGSTLPTLHLTGAVTITSGALLSLDTTDLTATSYTLITAASGLDSAHGFTLGAPLPTGYELVYDGTTLKLNYVRPITAFWTGKVDSSWSTLSSGTSNWATAVDGVTDTAALPAALTDVTFSATGVGSTQTNLDVDYTIKSLTVESDTGISTTGTQTLTVNNSTTVNALLAINSGVTLIGKGDLTVSTTGTLAGSGAVEMALDRSILVNGAISVGDPSAFPGAQVLSLTTSGTGAIVMGAASSLLVNLYTGAGLGDNTGISTAADQLSLHGTLNATAGGTLVIGNHLVTPVFAGGDQWKVIDLNGGAGTITGQLAVNDSSLGLATGFVGTFDQTTGIYSIADIRPELTASSSGLAMANAEGQAIISGVQTGLNDINNHLFNLRSGGGEEEEESDGSIAASLDYGVVVGEGDGPENPIAKRIKRTRQWEVFTTVNYGNARLNPISSQSGVQIDSWASSVGIERHLSRHVTVGFAATFLQSTQTYTGGLGKVDLEGPMLSAYVSYVRKGFWSSLLYSFGDFDLGSQRIPGLGLPSAAGGTNAYTNAIQYNTGWNFRFQNNTLVTGPFVGIDYLHGSVDAYSETGGGLGALSYARQTFESLVTRIGWSTSKKFETNWATITPQFRLSYERQNLKNNGTSVSLINAPFTAAGGNQTPGQDYMVLGTGVNFQFTPDFSMLLGYQVQLFRNNMEAHFGSVRFGYKF
jgi:outer membrane autotransporter protein